MWDLWSNFIKIIFSFGPTEYCMLFSWLETVTICWRCSVRMEPSAKMHKVPLTWMLAETWAKHPLCQVPDMCHVGSYALAVHRIALQVWHTELFGRKTCLFFGTQPDGVACVYSDRCRSSPAAEVVICGSSYSAEGGASGSCLKQQEKDEGVLSDG